MTDLNKQATDPVDSAPAEDKPAPAVDGGQTAGTDQYGRQLFDVTCSSCGSKTQVPFKPSGDRPVYCRDCFMKQRSNQGSGKQFGQM